MFKNERGIQGAVSGSFDPDFITFAGSKNKQPYSHRNRQNKLKHSMDSRFNNIGSGNKMRHVTVHKGVKP